LIHSGSEKAIMALTGKRILVTRSRQQASDLSARLEAAGAQTILIPTIELAPPASFCGLDAALACISSYDWVIFTSANAVQIFNQRAKLLGLMPNPKKIAVIGPATAKAVQEIGFVADLTPQHYVAEGLADALLPHADGASMLLVRAETAREYLPDTLRAAGAAVIIANAYRTLTPASSVALLQQVWSDPGSRPDAVTFTSSSTVINLFTLLEAAGLNLPDRIVRASMGPITSQTLQDLGHPKTIEAEDATIASLCDALERHYTPL